MTTFVLTHEVYGPPKVHRVGKPLRLLTTRGLLGPSLAAILSSLVFCSHRVVCAVERERERELKRERGRERERVCVCVSGSGSGFDFNIDAAHVSFLKQCHII